MNVIRQGVILMCFALSIQANAQSHELDETIQFKKDLILYKYHLPQHFNLVKAVKGDLNRDGRADLVLMVKATDPQAWVVNRFNEKVDRNRRGIIVLLDQQDRYQKLVQNLNAFSSENEEGGVYFSPELSIEIKNQKLKINYAHGRYGGWGYTFRVEGQDLRLIGYDSSNHMDTLVQHETSLNFLTQKMLKRDNIYKDQERQPVFRESWSRVNIAPI